MCDGMRAVVWMCNEWLLQAVLQEAALSSVPSAAPRLALLLLQVELRLWRFLRAILRLCHRLWRRMLCRSQLWMCRCMRALLWLCNELLQAQMS